MFVTRGIKLLLYILFCISIVKAEDTQKITVDFAGTKTEIPKGDEPYGTVIFNDIILKLPMLNGANNKVTYKIEDSNLNRVAEELKKTTILTKGADNVIGTQNDFDTNMFLKGFKQESYDENGFYVGKLDAWTGGLSKGYIYKTYLVLDSKEQKSYKVIEFKRVNFLDEIVEIYANYVERKREIPLFIPASGQYVDEYLNILRGKIPNTPNADTLNQIHSVILATALDTSKSYGVRKVATSAELLPMLTNKQLLRDTIKAKFSNIIGTKAGFNGYGNKLFENDGLVLNYATILAENQYPNGEGKDNFDSNSDYNDILYMHLSFASTIMTHNNIRNGYFVASGLPGYEAFTSDQYSTPFQCYGSQKKRKLKWGRKEFIWDGACTFEGDQLFALQSNDYINLNNMDNADNIVKNIYEEQRLIPTVLPFADAVSAQSISHQGHLLSHLASFIGYGTRFGGNASNSFTKYDHDAVNSALGKHKSVPYLQNGRLNYTKGTHPDGELYLGYSTLLNSFGAIEAGYTTIFENCGGEICGQFNGHEKKKKTKPWLIPLILGILTAGFFGLILVIPSLEILGIILIAIGFHYSALKMHVNAGYVNTTPNTIATENITAMGSAIDPAVDINGMNQYLGYSDVYEELFAIQPSETNSMFDTAYSLKIAEISHKDEFDRLKDPKNNIYAIVAKNITSQKEYDDVFRGVENFGYQSFKTRFENDLNIINILHDFMRGN